MLQLIAILIIVVVVVFQGKLPLTNIAVRRLEDTESIKNAFEIQGTLIEAIIAVCQGPAEADKWVDLLAQNLLDKRRTGTMDPKRNVSTSSVSSSTAATATVTGPQSHVNISITFD